MTPRAAAQSVALDLHACAEPAPRDVRAVLEVELHGRLVGDGQAAPEGTRLVVVRCTRDQAELSLSGSTSQRTIALASVPAELRARLLALAIAELARPPLTTAAPQRRTNAKTGRSPHTPANGRNEPRSPAPIHPPPTAAPDPTVDSQRTPANGHSETRSAAPSDVPPTAAPDPTGDSQRTPASGRSEPRSAAPSHSPPTAAPDPGSASLAASASTHRRPAADGANEVEHPIDDTAAQAQLKAAAVRNDAAESTATDNLRSDDETAPTTPRPSATDAHDAQELELDAPSTARWLWLSAAIQPTPLLGWGGALQFDTKLAPWLVWSSALSLGAARADIERGKLRVLSASLRTGVAWLAQGPRTTFHAGAGVRGRWLELMGEPSDGASTTAKHFTAWSLGPSLFAGTHVLIAGPLFLALELELHHALREVKANVEDGASRTLSPWQTSAALGAGLAW